MSQTRNKKREVYLDYAATTPVDPRVLKAMLPYFGEKFGNPSSIHLKGQEARAEIEKARKKVADVLNCSSREIYFTGTTTTSNNLAILGTARVAKKAGWGNHLITSEIEHHAVLDTYQALEKEGFDLTVLPVSKLGLIDPKEVKKAMTDKTIFVSVMYANNEVGTIQPIQEIGTEIQKRKGAKKNYPYLHTDAATVVDYLQLDVKKLGVDLMTLGAHKFGGPKGIGLLYVRDGVKIEPITYGGHHERGLWPGTESVPLIIGLTKALELAAKERGKMVLQVAKLRDKLIKGVLGSVPNSQLSGHPSKRLPDIASFIFKGVEGESVLLMLSDQGIAASSGSACTSGELKPSHVLTAMGISPEAAHGSIRFSLGKKTTEEEIDYVLKVLPGVIKRLRLMAPNFNANLKMQKSK
ncbi:cysteine desulfurase family protein [Patescibacteria group bacterium]